MFSIVIPAYNNLPLLRRALESVRCQRDVTWEAIVMDDSDLNADIQHYVTSLHDPRISYQHNVPSLGAVPNWNRGLSKAQGNYMILLHHDESLQTDDYLLQLESQLDTHDIVVGNVEVHRNDGRTYGLAPAWVKRLALHWPSMLFAANVLGPSAVFAFRRECLADFDTRMHWLVDVEWYYRMLKGHDACYLPNAKIASWHGHKGQITGSVDAAFETRKDATLLAGKYHACPSIRLALWLYADVIHSPKLNRIIKTLLRR